MDNNGGKRICWLLENNRSARTKNAKGFCRNCCMNRLGRVYLFVGLRRIRFTALFRSIQGINKAGSDETIVVRGRSEHNRDIESPWKAKVRILIS